MSAASRRNTRPRTEQQNAAPAGVQPAEEVAAQTPPASDEQPAGDGASTPPPAETTSEDQVPAEDHQPPVTEQPPTDDQPPAEVEPAAAAPVARTADGRPACRVGRDVAPELPACDKPEFIDDFGICGGHYAIRPDLRKEAYRG